MCMHSLLHEAARILRIHINDIVYKIDARQNPSDFSRQGKLGLTNTVMLSLNCCAKSLQVEIDNFYEVIGRSECSVTRSGYLDARMKLKPEAFSMLLDDTIKLAAGNHPLLMRLYGYRLYAIDGSTIILEDTIALRGEFGVSGGEKGVASGRLSTLNERNLFSALGNRNQLPCTKE